MRVKFLFVFAALVTMSAIAYAQGAGTWTGEAQGCGRGGPQMVTVVLNADGTGTFKQGDQPEGELSEVVIDGNSVSFQRMVAGRGGGRGGNFTVSYAGEVDGDTLTLNISVEGRGGRGGRGGGRGGRGGGPQQLVLTRQ